jgi:aldose 1-epimerase
MGYFGAVVGPVANRIGGARAVIAGETMISRRTRGRTCCTAAPAAHTRRSGQLTTWPPAHSTLSLDLPDGLGGFPGNPHLTAAFALDGRRLTLDLTATTDAPTLMNLANHSYWRLGGTGHAGHRLRSRRTATCPSMRR